MNLYSHRLDGARRCAGKAPVIHQAAAELIVDRMDASAPNAGLTTWKGNRVRKADITIAKNYLAAGEIDELNRITTRFLDFAVWSQKPGSSRASGRADHLIRNTSHSACVPLVTSISELQNTARFRLAGAVPAKVLADMLGISVATFENYARLSDSTTRGDYPALRATDRVVNPRQ